MYYDKNDRDGVPAFHSRISGPFITSFFTLRTGDLILIILSVFKAKRICDLSGKISDHECFRIGNIGEIYPEDILELTAIIKDYKENVND